MHVACELERSPRYSIQCWFNAFERISGGHDGLSLQKACKVMSCFVRPTRRLASNGG